MDTHYFYVLFLLTKSGFLQGRMRAWTPTMSMFDFLTRSESLRGRVIGDRGNG
jgi:hypothetical protein